MFGLSIISTKKLKELTEMNEKLIKEDLDFLEDYSNLYDRFNHLQFIHRSLKTKIDCLEARNSLFYNIGKITMVPNEDGTCLYYKSKYEDGLEVLKQKCLRLHEILERYHLEE